MVLTMTPLPGFAESEDLTASDLSKFPDVTGHWASNQIDKWADIGLIKGDERGFRPNDSITRAEMAVILDNLMAYQTKAANAFSDVPGSAWYADAIGKANAAGVLSGDGAGHAFPLNNITREEAAVMLARSFAVDTNNGTDTGFKDAQDISSWAKPLVFGMEAYKYIGGKEDSTFNPKANITRAEVVTIVNNAVKGYYTEAGTYTGDLYSVVSGANYVVIVKAANVIIKDSEISGDLIIAEGVGDGDFTLDNTKVSGKLVARGGGADSIVITGGSNVQNIYIQRVDGQVRVFAEDGTEIGTVILDGKDDVIVDGTIGNVSVLSEDITVIVGENAKVDTITVEGENTVVSAGKGSKIDNVVVNGSGTTIKGEGAVAKVVANANNVAVTTKDTKVTAAQGTSGVTAGNNPVEPGTTQPTNGTPASGGGGGGGSSSSKIAVSAVGVEGVTGTGAILTAKPTPANATVTYQWLIADAAAGDYTNISGATNSTYTPVDGDVDKYIKVTVTGTGSYKGTVTSADPVGPIQLLAGEFSNNAVSTKAHGTVDGYIVDVRLNPATATFANAAVVVSLVDENGTVMQKNTLKNEHGLTGTSLTSSFDVKGTFDYAEDGYWVVEGSVKDDFTAPVKVIIQVTLGNGKVLRTELTGIMPATLSARNETKDIYYETIQAAIADAAENDTILVGEGTFNEEIKIEKPVKLIGAGIGKTVLQAKDTNSDYIIWLGSASNYGLDLSGTVIEGFSVHSPLKAEKDMACIYLTAQGTEGNEIVIESNEFSGPTDEVNQGIAVLTPYSPEIKHVKITDNQINDMKYGMYFNSISNVKIIGNTMDKTIYTGIVFYGKAEYPCDNIEITGNSFTDIASAAATYDALYHAGISFYYYGENRTIEDNTFGMLNELPDVYYWGDDALAGGKVINATQKEEYDTIQAAISAATSGDTIVVGAKTHAVNSVININKDLNIVGKEGAVFESAGSNSILQPSNGATLTVSNIEFKGTKQAQQRGIDMVAGTEVIVTECTFDTLIGGIYANPGAKINVSESAFRNVIAAIGTDTAASDLTITDNTFEATCDEAVGFTAPNDTEANFNALKADIIANNTGATEDNVKSYGAFI